MPVNRMSSIAAAPAPRTMPQNRSFGGSARTAIAMTTALSPDNNMLIPMICSAASQKVGRIISDIKASTVRSQFRRQKPSCPAVATLSLRSALSLLGQKGGTSAKRTAQCRSSALAHYLIFREELCNFPHRGIGSIRAMYGILTDRSGVDLTDRSRCGLRGVGRPHNFAVLRNGIFAFEHLYNDRA